MNRPPPDEIAVVSGLLRTSRYVGAILSSSVIAITFGESANDADLHTVVYVFADMGIIRHDSCARRSSALLDSKVSTPFSLRGGLD